MGERGVESRSRKMFRRSQSIRVASETRPLDGVRRYRSSEESIFSDEANGQDLQNAEAAEQVPKDRLLSKSYPTPDASSLPQASGVLPSTVSHRRLRKRSVRLQDKAGQAF